MKNSPTTEIKEETFYITTLGCPKNVADSASIYSSMVKTGFSPLTDPDEAKYHLINTCTFIQEATEETIQTILNAVKIKKTKDQKLILVGCFAERYSKQISEEIPEVDFFFGTGKYSEAGNLIRNKFSPNFMVPENTWDMNRLNFEDRLSGNYDHPYSYVKISDGCNRGCTFCIIPNLRGNFKDYATSEIEEEVQKSLSYGVKEICLVSQDTVFYGGNVQKLIELISHLAGYEKLEILRFLYLYPDKKTEKLIDLFGKIEKIAPYLECPLQHVSENVIKSMNRSGSYSFYKDLFQKARDVKKDLEIRTSFILGFPGETSHDVDQLIQFIHETKPEKINLFSYSREEGTKSHSLDKQVPEKEKVRRVNLVREEYMKILSEIHQSRIGKVYDCIVDECEDGNTTVRRFQDAPEIDEVVYIHDQKLEVGQIGKVKIRSFYELDMEGDWVIG